MTSNGQMTSNGRVFALAAAMAMILAGCGGSDDPADSAPAADGTTAASQDEPAQDEPAQDQSAQDIADDLAGAPSGDAQATVVIDGETYHFAAVEPGADDDFFNLCTTVAGSLQGVLQQVDEAGTYLGAGEISFIFLEPGGGYESTGDPAELQINLADGAYYSSFDGGEVNVPMSGNAASGDFTIGGVSGSVEASC